MSLVLRWFRNRNKTSVRLVPVHCHSESEPIRVHVELPMHNSDHHASCDANGWLLSAVFMVAMASAGSAALNTPEPDTTTLAPA